MSHDACTTTVGRPSRRRPIDRREQLAAAFSAVRAGDPGGWPTLHGILHRTAVAVAHQDMRMSPSEADDVAQDMWVKLLPRLAEIHEPRALNAWVRTTVRRECLRRTRRVGAGREVPSERVGDGRSTLPDPEESAVHADERATVSRVLGRLPGERRRLLDLLTDDRTDYDGIAAATGMPRGSIGPTRGRLLAKLRAEPELAALR